MATHMALNIFDRLKARGHKDFLPAPANVFQNPLLFFAFGLGSGAIPFAPGTWGTLLAIPFFLLIQPLPLQIYVAIVFVFVVISIWICSTASREIGIHDHPGMNIDEFAGFFVAMIHAPATLGYIALGFCLFRLFDIFKPLGIRYLDRELQGGLGMILDDVLAGIYTAIVIQVVVLVAGR